jgi:hypothetical protein
MDAQVNAFSGEFDLLRSSNPSAIASKGEESDRERSHQLTSHALPSGPMSVRQVAPDA